MKRQLNKASGKDTLINEIALLEGEACFYVMLFCGLLIEAVSNYNTYQRRQMNDYEYGGLVE
jgi:hypothetical protein